MKNTLFTRLVSLSLILIFISGCSTTMNIYTVDSIGNQVTGATVMIDGENIGQTPNASKKVSNFAASDIEIRVIAEGFRTRITEPMMEIKVGTFICALIPPLWLLMFWAWGPRTQQYVILSPEQ